MNVKCPKCRFRFDVPAAPGITEVHCNCPRCGIPFTYTADDEVAATAGQGEAPDSTHAEPMMANGVSRKPAAEHGAPHPAAPEGGYATSSAAANTADRGFAATPPPIPPHATGTSESPNRPFSDSHLGRDYNVPPMGKAPRGRGCLRYILVFAACIVVGVIFLVNQCASSTSYDAQAVGLAEPDAAQASAAEITVPTPSYNEQEPPGKAPSWIQGNWHVDTDYGGISLKIYGDNIAETSGGETSFGHYRYQNHRLYCNFGDGEVFVYRLVEETQQIDAGNGILMRKIE